MKKKLTKEDVINRIHTQMAENNVPFYRVRALNYSGECMVNSVSCPYSEIIAEWLYNSFQTPEEWTAFLLKNNHMLPERNFPAAPIHQKSSITFTAGSRRNEENIAKRLMQLGAFPVSGAPGMCLVDYQVPINRIANTSEGKVDLVFSMPGQIIIGELKDEDSKDTLLHAVVEAKSYQCRIETEKTALHRFVSCYLPECTADIDNYITGKLIQPAVLIFNDNASKPWQDLDWIKGCKHSYLKKLITRWDIMVFEVVTINYTTYLKDKLFEINRVL